MRWPGRLTEGGACVTASGSGALRAPLAIGLQGDGWALRAPPSVLRRSGCRLRSAGNTMLNTEWLTVNSVVSASRGNIKVVSMSRKSGKAALYQGRGLVVRQPKTAGYVKGLQRAYAKEKGYVDIASAAYAFDTTGSVTLLNTVAQGAAVTQRVGKKIVMKGLQFRGFMQNGTTATANDVAFMIVYDKRPRSACGLTFAAARSLALRALPLRGACPYRAPPSAAREGALRAGRLRRFGAPRRVAPRRAPSALWIWPSIVQSVS